VAEELPTHTTDSAGFVVVLGLTERLPSPNTRPEAIIA